MGCVSSKPQVDILTVDHDGSKSKSNKLTANVFMWKNSANNEFDILKHFAQQNGIAQGDLVVVFKMYLMNDEAFLRNFHVAVKDVKSKFLRHSKLNQVLHYASKRLHYELFLLLLLLISVLQELADIFFPMLYYKDIKRMQPPQNPEEVSFARFLVISYIFGNESMADLIFDFFCLLKRSFKIKV